MFLLRGLIKPECIFLGLVLAIPIFVAVLTTSAEESSEQPEQISKIIISEVKLGDGDNVTFPDGSTAKDFVTVYNQSSETVSLSGWKLEYSKADGFSANCNDADWAVASSNITDLSGELSAGTISLPIKRSMNDGTDGQIRLIDGNGMVQDLVGWGVTSQCYEAFPSLTPPDNSGKSLQRYLDCDGSTIIDTNNNLLDFSLSDAPSPGGMNYPLHPDCTEGGQGGSEPANSCEGVVLTELLPNPAGSDAGSEFIELYNPTGKNISLQGCGLETTANSKLFTFGNVTIKSKQYLAFYDDITGLTLANSSGGTVYLIDADDSELDSASYQAGLEDDTAWALNLSSGKWSITYIPTPGAANEIVSIKPCPAGQIRNIATNRCNNIVTEAGLGPCPEGKKRNPETNRCRNIASLAEQLKPCRSDQIRNPETNRCKKIASGNSLKPCKANQKRNPETNRCRKVASASAADGGNIKDVVGETSADNQLSWTVAGFGFLGALSYGVWEWRRDILEKLMALKARFS